MTDSSLLSHEIKNLIKTGSISQEKACPWINQSILNLRRICCKAERLWKKTELGSISEISCSLEMKSEYFSRLISKNEKS